MSTHRLYTEEARTAHVLAMRAKEDVFAAQDAADRLVAMSGSSRARLAFGRKFRTLLSRARATFEQLDRAARDALQRDGRRLPPLPSPELGQCRGVHALVVNGATTPLQTRDLQLITTALRAHARQSGEPHLATLIKVCSEGLPAHTNVVDVNAVEIVEAE